MSAFGVILVRIFSHSEWIRRDTEYLPYSVRMQENAHKNNSEYGHFSRSDMLSLILIEFNFPQRKYCVIEWKKIITNKNIADLKKCMHHADFGKIIYFRRKYTQCYCSKSVLIQSFSSSYFPAFELNAKIYSLSVNCCIFSNSKSR